MITILLLILVLSVLLCNTIATTTINRKQSDASDSKDDNKDDNKDDSKDGNLPTIFILGVQKGGSSSLYEFLIEHPLLCGGIHKEPHFFDHEPYSHKTREDYLKMYPTVDKCKSSKARYIDGTTVMYKLEVASDRMAQFYTEKEREKLKFIVLVREPVSRDYSWYGQVMRDKLGNGIKFSQVQTFAEADAKRDTKERDAHIHRSGRYIEQLQHFIRNFRRDQILIISSQAVFQNSSSVMDSVSGFLGINKIDKWNGPFPHDNHLDKYEWRSIIDCIVSHIPKLDCKMRDELAAYYKPWNTLLQQWMITTKVNASKWEPPFLPFKDSYKNISCVSNAREEFEEILKKNPKQLSCKKN